MVLSWKIALLFVFIRLSRRTFLFYKLKTVVFGVYLALYGVYGGLEAI